MIMKEIYSEEYRSGVKRQYIGRLALLIALIVLFLAAYIISIITPQIKWITFVIAIAGALICCTAGILLLARCSKKRRMLIDIANGLTTEETLTFAELGQPRDIDLCRYNTVLFTGRDETGREYERELHLEAEPEFRPGDTVLVRTYRGFITAYEILR